MPAAPPVADARSGHLALTVLWEHPSDGSVDRYLVYRAANRGDLDALDLLSPTVIDRPVVSMRPPGPADVAEDLELRLAEGDPEAASLRWGIVLRDLTPGPVWMAVVAEEAIPGGAPPRSPPRIVELRAREVGPPAPPVVRGVTRTGAAISLECACERAWHQLLVDVREDGAIGWRNAVAWSAGGARTVSLTAPAPDAACEIRLRSRNAAGVPSGATFLRVAASGGGP